MEFKDRIANKPNRVKLTYEDSGASSYATVELADEPIEEGTPLNKETFDGLQNEFNEQIDDLSNDVDGLMQKLDKATLLFDYTQNNNKPLHEGESGTALTNTKFLIYYIAIQGFSTIIIAGGAWFDYGGQQGWAIRGSGVNPTPTNIEEYFASLLHVGNQITVANAISRTQKIADGKLSYTSGQGITRIWGIGKV